MFVSFVVKKGDRKLETKKPIVIGDRLQLRGTVRDDIPMKVRWYNDPDVNKTLVLPETLELEKSYQWFDRRVLQLVISQKPLFGYQKS